MSLSDSQLENAAIVVRVGQELGASRDQIVAALSAAWVETRFGRDTLPGDPDSSGTPTAWGIFQQRAVAGWSSRDVVLNPYNAAREFFLGSPKGNPGLFDNWNPLAPGESVANTQRPKLTLRGRYQAEMSYARSVLEALEGIVGAPVNPSVAGAVAPGSSGRDVGSVSRENGSQVQSASNTVPFKPNPNLPRVLVLGVGLVLIVLAGVKLSG